MDNRIFGLDPQLLFDTAIGLLAMLVLFILLSYLLFNPARKLIQKRKEFIASQLEEAAKAEKDAKELETQYRAKLDKVEDEAEEMLSDARKKALDKRKRSLPRLPMRLRPSRQEPSTRWNWRRIKFVMK